MYWEFPSYNGQQAVRFGKWKAIRKNIFDGNMEVELYNLHADPMEQQDVSDQYPEILEKAKKYMEEERETPDVVGFRMEQLGDTL